MDLKLTPLIDIGPPSSPLLPDARGFFGEYGGQFIPEVLHPSLSELTAAFASLVNDPSFWAEYYRELCLFSGRPTPITPCANLSQHLGGAQIFLKREDLNQTGAHKISNVIGQGLLAKRLGKRRVIAETGAGQHGVATATMAARMGLEACIYMGAEDVDRQRPNVFWMERLGAKVVAVESGARTLKDAINEALRDWSANFATTHYVLGTACGPHPFPALVAYLTSVIGREARQQIEELTGGMPDRVYACVGGGSNALGLFQGFFNDDVELVGVEAGGHGLDTAAHASRLASGTAHVGIAQGYKTRFLQDSDGQMQDTHSVAAGLDYVGVSPILAHWHDTGQMRAEATTDEEVIAAVSLLMQQEGIIAALESAHGLAAAIREAPELSPENVLLVNLSGRGDKDIFTFAEAFQDRTWGYYLAKRAQRLGATK